MKKTLLRTAMALTMTLALATIGLDGLAAQEASFGGQVSFATGNIQDVPGLDDAGPGLGARVALPLAEVPLLVTGTFDYFFPEDVGGTDVNYWELNGNVAYLFDVSPDSGVQPYGGGGLNLSFLEILDENETELGLNLLGGALFPSESLTPFVEIRMELRGGEQFVVAGGILF